MKSILIIALFSIALVNASVSESPRFLDASSEDKAKIRQCVSSAQTIERSIVDLKSNFRFTQVPAVIREVATLVESCQGINARISQSCLQSVESVKTTLLQSQGALLNYFDVEKAQRAYADLLTRVRTIHEQCQY